MTRVQASYAITSIANTNSEEVEIDEPILEVADIQTGTKGHPQNGDVSSRQDVSGRHLNRAQEVLEAVKIRTFK